MLNGLLTVAKVYVPFCLSETYSCEYGSSKYYALCGVGGLLSCGITHTLVTPLDMVKCRIQTNPAKYKSIVNGFRVTSWTSMIQDHISVLVLAIGFDCWWGYARARQRLGSHRHWLFCSGINILINLKVKYGVKPVNFVTGCLQIWILWSFQNHLCQCFGRRECLRLPNWFVPCCICLSRIFRRYCSQPNGSRQSAYPNHARFPCNSEGWSTHHLQVNSP